MRICYFVVPLSVCMYVYYLRVYLFIWYLAIQYPTLTPLIHPSFYHTIKMRIAEIGGLFRLRVLLLHVNEEKNQTTDSGVKAVLEELNKVGDI